MTLVPGIYFIKCMGTKTLIGRDQATDSSSEPEPIYSNPKGHGLPLFIVEKQQTSEDCFVIRDPREGLVGEKDNLLWLFSNQDDTPPTTNWLISRRDQLHGQNVFTIEKPDHSAGWVVPVKTRSQTQVAVEPLVDDPSNPHKYPVTALFEFIRFDRQ